ncbi:hypothetical protein B0H17DRAFT_1073158 [Mycena rosella]|uniref:Uncharacterized protein n=1 Tax=Mycena rosella TaxID=1033263 RepID=A0AAD7D8L8_MYCRO|nr:hypothetical protein B0H17DRAFT_1073158 [Mycena rosella]
MNFSLPTTLHLAVRLLRPSIQTPLSVGRIFSTPVAVGAQVLQGADPHSREFLVLVTENNTPVPLKLVYHLRTVFDRLRGIRAIRPKDKRASMLIDPGIPSVSSDPFDRELVDLEVIVLTHSWEKLKHWVLKQSKYLNFLSTASDVCGMPAQQRTDRDTEERECLGQLQTLLDRGHVERLVQCVEDLVNALVLNPSVDDVVSVRPVLQFVTDQLVKMKRNTNGSHVCISVRLENVNIKVRKQPGVLRWLSNVVSIREHYLRIADVVTSKTLAETLLQGGISVALVTNPAPHATLLSLDSEKLTRVLAAAECLGLEKEPVNRFFHMLRTAHSKHTPTSKLALQNWEADQDKSAFEISISSPVHCE